MATWMTKRMMKNNMVIVKQDDLHFDIEKIMNSGQCFRIYKIKDSPNIGVYEVMSARMCLRIIHDKSQREYHFVCEEDEFHNYWENYFDLQTDYSQFYDKIRKEDAGFVCVSAEYGYGIRILRQDYWETIVSFLISQNNNIPKIKKSIEALCEKFGQPINRYGILRYTFPTKDELQNATIEELQSCGLGYRAEYVYNVIHLPAEALTPDYESLQKIAGIGPKVASCIMLYGAHDMSQFPIDTWMEKVLNSIYKGLFDITPYKGFEGFIQQLMFYYYRDIARKVAYKSTERWYYEKR